MFIVNGVPVTCALRAYTTHYSHGIEMSSSQRGYLCGSVGYGRNAFTSNDFHENYRRVILESKDLLPASAHIVKHLVYTVLNS